MCESTSKLVVKIPTASESEAFERNEDRPLWVLNETGRGLIEPRSPRPWDGETISVAGFFSTQT
jgi:hypothetical protein